MMGKRSRETDSDRQPAPKRLRPSNHDRLSHLSDELLLRTLSYLSVSDLVLCQRLSRRLKTLAGDSQLWKALFYDRFVRPRASRIPGLRDQAFSESSLYYSSKISKWLDDDHLLKRGKGTNWKRQYKLRHNWSRGSATVSETQVAEQSSTPPLLVRLNGDIVVIADAISGLRAWSLKGEYRLIASLPLTGPLPTALAIDDTTAIPSEVNLSIGFDDGSFELYRLEKEQRRFTLLYRHAASTNGSIHAIACASPYLVTMIGEPLLSLYTFEPKTEDRVVKALPSPRLLSSLRSQTAYPPISLAIRISRTAIVASIAYAMPTWTLGWSVGLQELRLTTEGKIMESRTAAAPSQGLSERSPWIGINRPSLADACTPALPKPTSISYNHPYLLSSHADNTLTLHMVSSTAEELKVGRGNRLWGHTSSVSGAHVGDRGKAVSVSARGNELRVWELEGGLSSSASRRRAAAGEASVQVRPEQPARQVQENVFESSNVGKLCIPTGLEEEQGDMNVTKGWVAFDEEKVVLLREKLKGAQALVVYDFS